MIPDTPSSAASGMGDDALLRALIEELRPYASGPLGSIRVDTDDIRKIVDGFDALSAKDRELAEAREARQRSIDYSIDLQRIIEDLCGGRNIREPGTTARYHYDMAVAAERERDEALSALREKEERVKVLEEALRPFGALAASYFHRYETRPGVFRESHQDDPDDRSVYGINRVEITTGDFRRARAVLANSKSEGV